MNFGEINLVHIIINEYKISDEILRFLKPLELSCLRQCCHVLNEQIQIKKSFQLKNEFDEWIQSFQKKKQKKKQEIRVMQTINVFEVPLKFFKNWKPISQNESIIKCNIKSEKYLVDQNNSFFVNDNQDILFVNRSMVDNKLDLKKKTYITDDKSENYKHFYEKGHGEQLNFDFSDMNSLLHRQSKMISQYEKNALQNNNSNELDCLKHMLELKRIAIILCFGGNFSIGIFEKEKCIFHKSDHKYVCRKKGSGQRQIVKDSGKSISSMGSQIRRANEKLHQENIENILDENLDEIQKCDIIFLQAPGINRQILIDENKTLFQLKDKIRSVILNTKKANYTEVERIHKIITKCYFIIKK